MSTNVNTTSGYAPRDFTDPSTPHDRVLVVGEEKTKFYVYAGYLSYCSEFFQTLFTGDFKEKDETEIEIKELEAIDFQAFLNALIPGNHSSITVDNYLFVLACAHRFLASDVLNMSEKFVLSNFDTLDKIDLLKMAFEYEWIELKDKLATYLVPISLNLTAVKCAKGCKVDLGVWCKPCGTEIIPTNLTGPLPNSSFLVENEVKLSALPDEIHSFILKELLKKSKK